MAVGTHSMCYCPKCDFSCKSSVYCQTLLNKSSPPPPKPPCGLAVWFELAAPPPVLLAQPPNSSSCATAGVTLRVPLCPGTMLWLANDPPVLPHAPKSLPPKAEGWLSAGLLTAGAGAAAGAAGSPHALPHTSELLKLLMGFAAAAGGEVGLGAERLKTESIAGAMAGAGGEGALVGSEVGAGAGLDRSNRSPMADEAGCAGFAGAGAGAPHPPKLFDGDIGLMACGVAGLAGLESKKLPAPRPPMVDVDCGVDFLPLPKLVRPAKASFGGLLGDAMLLLLPKLSPAKSPARLLLVEFWAWWPMVGDCTGEAMEPQLPKEPEGLWPCCGWAWGRGAEAYRDRIDCFRSGRDWPPMAAVPVVLAGRGGAAGVLPRKSRSNKESLAVVALAGAGAALGGGAWATAEGPAVLARGGRSSPPMRSPWMLFGAAAWPTEALRMDSLRSICCFSLTMLRGMSSSPSTLREAGSGMGPSITHRLSSYFVRMKFSILASEGTWPLASLFSQYLFARALPQLRMLASCSSVQESRSTDLTREMCVPMPRWMPEQRMQMKTPRFQLAHRGSARRG